MIANPVRHIDLALRLLLLALLLCLALGAVLVVTKTRPQPLPVPQSVLRTQDINVPRAGVAPGGALVQNPLFWEGRRPYIAPDEAMQEETATAQPSGPTLVDEMKLVGIIGAGIEYSGVIVRLKERRLRIEVGEEIEGWELTGLARTEAKFTGVDRNGEFIERTLTLKRSNTSSEMGAGLNLDVRERFAPASRAAFSEEGGGGNEADAAVDEDSQDSPQNNQDQDDPRGSDE